MRTIPLLAASLLLLAAPCIAQEATAPTTATSAAAVDRSAFEKAFADYKAHLRGIEDLRIEYQTANNARREELNKELRKMVQTGQPKVDKMVDEALKLYEAAPESDPQVTDLLVAVGIHKVIGSGQNHQGGDQYEASLRIIRLLLANGNKTKGLASVGVVAAFCCNEFDLVKEYAALVADRQEDAKMFDDGLAKLVSEFSNPGMIKRYQDVWQREKKIREAEAKADDLPRVKFETTKGDVVIELFENEAPIATANMISLVKSKFYDGVIFHRVLPRFMAQGGDPQGTGTGGPGYCIPCECGAENARMHFRGSLSMAHAGKDTGGSQFFLTFVPTAHLNEGWIPRPGHTVFGRVVEGMDVLGNLQRIEPGERGAVEDEIIKATVVRDRGHSYSFKKLPAR